MKVTRKIIEKRHEAVVEFKKLMCELICEVIDSFVRGGNAKVSLGGVFHIVSKGKDRNSKKVVIGVETAHFIHLVPDCPTQAYLTDEDSEFICHIYDLTPTDIVALFDRVKEIAEKE